MFKLTAALVLVLGVSVSVVVNRAAAQEAGAGERLQAATELLSIMSKDLMVQMVGQMTNAYWPNVEMEARSGGVDEATLVDLHETMNNAILDFMTPLMDKAPPIYASHFTAEELRELADFYRTPVGKKSLKELPKVMGEFTEATMALEQGMQATLYQTVVQVLRKHGYCGPQLVKCQ
jgi:hypothetical protein